MQIDGGPGLRLFHIEDAWLWAVSLTAVREMWTLRLTVGLRLHVELCRQNDHLELHWPWDIWSEIEELGPHLQTITPIRTHHEMTRTHWWANVMLLLRNLLRLCKHYGLNFQSMRAVLMDDVSWWHVFANICFLLFTSHISRHLVHLNSINTDIE